MKNKREELIKSPLNYIGGKYKILSQLLDKFPPNISTFVDLFCGGFNVGINVNAEKILANDLNLYVIEIFTFLQTSNLDKVLSDIDGIIHKYSLSKSNREGYMKLRNDYNKNKNPLALLVLTFFSFNHQIRYNSKFEFNCPFGENRSAYNSSIKTNLTKFVNRLHEIPNIEFLAIDFLKLDFDCLDLNSFVYCDPPYLITNGSYNDGSRGFGDWTVEKDKDLLSLLDNLSDRGIKFALSNVLEHKGIVNTHLLEWSKKYKVTYIDNNFNNSNYQTNAKFFATKEVIITNF